MYIYIYICMCEMIFLALSLILFLSLSPSRLLSHFFSRLHSLCRARKFFLSFSLRLSRSPSLSSALSLAISHV